VAIPKEPKYQSLQNKKLAEPSSQKSKEVGLSSEPKQEHFKMIISWHAKRNPITS